VVSSVVWARQLAQKVQANQKAAQSLFQDLATLQKFDSECKDICAQIKEFEDG